LWCAQSEVGEFWTPLDQLRKLTGLQDLSITGRHFDARVPPAVSALSRLTRLAVGLRWEGGAREGPNADSAPLWRRRGRNGRPCPIAGCAALRELVLHDRGARLELGDADGLASLTALTCLDLGGVANPVVSGTWVLDLARLQRLVVPPGVLGLVEARRRAAASGARTERRHRAAQAWGRDWLAALQTVLHVLRSLLLT
jgi:hypothetical protein